MDVSTPMNSFDKKWLFSEGGGGGQVQTVRSKMHSASRNKRYKLYRTEGFKGTVGFKDI